jgi:hypothetical protein
MLILTVQEGWRIALKWSDVGYTSTSCWREMFSLYD